MFQVQKKLPTFYGIRSFITLFTTALPLYLSRGRRAQSKASHSTPSETVVMLSSHLHLSRYAQVPWKLRLTQVTIALIEQEDLW
jgi:hypothetical protein